VAPARVSTSSASLVETAGGRPPGSAFPVLVDPTIGRIIPSERDAPYDVAMATTTNASRTGRQSVVLAAGAIAVSDARAWLASHASGLVEADRLASLMLVMSEIVTNAVRHGDPRGEIRLAATPKDGYLCIQVTDAGPGFVPRPGAMASDEYGGFGLFLVERLTRRWGMTRENGRTRVWFEFDCCSPS